MATEDSATGVRTMKASEFKAKCLQLMDEVAKSGEEIVITKYGQTRFQAHSVQATPQVVPRRGQGPDEDHRRHRISPIACRVVCRDPDDSKTETV